MIEYNLISVNELQDAIENDLTDNHYKVAAEFLLNAISEWPAYNQNEPILLIQNLNTDIKRPLTYENLKQYLDSLNLNSELDSWKAESIIALLELFDFERKNKFDKTKHLETIILQITKHYKQVLKNST